MRSTDSGPILRHLAPVLLALAGSLLACSLTWGDSGGGGATPNPDQPAGGNAATTPNVRIVEPLNGQQVPRNQRVDVTVETDSTATSFLLNVDGRVASTRALPPEQSGGPTKAILSWLPDHDGTYTLEVVAYNGTNASAPASISLQVAGTASAGGTAGSCTARVMVSELNFRSGPGTTASKLGQFDLGETVTVLGRNDASTWLKIQRANSTQGWAINNRDWLQLDGSCDALPVVQ